jgi:hypothetical protein
VGGAALRRESRVRCAPAPCRDGQGKAKGARERALALRERSLGKQERVLRGFGRCRVRSGLEVECP